MGNFVTFEGIEGCGKSTQIQLLAEWLISMGQRVVLTREPGGTELGERIRMLLKAGDVGKHFSAKAELLLFEASRAQHVEEKILPALAHGDSVLCDRFLDSSTVYQGVARKIPPPDVALLNSFAAANLLPDLTIIVDITPEESVKRLLKRGGQIDRIEGESVKFFKDVRSGYLAMAEGDPRFLVVNGDQSISNIHGEIRREYGARFM
ncbi:MAG: dTMP kinase [Puniceicoccales bacterium]|jgi:dTMP kinase|nr:dTMP kinase [Puniceicoccales bacterium]